MQLSRRDLAVHGASVLALVVVAMVLRYPTSLAPGLVPCDTNTDLHVLLASALSEGSFGHVELLNHPEGVDMRMVALPLMLLAALLQPLGSVAGFHLAVMLWLVLNGVGLLWVGGRLGLDRAGALALAITCLVGTQTLSFLGSGQYENVVPLAFGVVLLATQQASTWRACALFAGSLFVSGFCSPYQAISVGLVGAGAALFSVGPRPLLAMALAGAVSLLPVAAYYASATEGPLGPAPALIIEALEFSLPQLQHRELISVVGLPYHGDLELPPLPNRGVGWVLPIAGVASFFALRKAGRPLAAGAVLVLLAALGPSIYLGFVTLPGPWALAMRLPGLGDMSAICRLGTGLSFVLALAVLRAWPTRWVAIGLPLAVAIETFLFSPGIWPVRAGWIGEVALDQPVGFYPSPPFASSDPSEWIAVAHGVPVAWSPPPDGDMRAWLGELRAQEIDRVVIHHGLVRLPRELSDCLEPLESLGERTTIYAIGCSGER